MHSTPSELLKVYLSWDFCR